MSPSRELAELLVDYDPQLAHRVLDAIIELLGGRPAGDDVARGRAFLSEADRGGRLSRHGQVGEAAATTTAEWKAEFTRHERLRSLGLALADRLEERGAAPG